MTLRHVTCVLIRTGHCVSVSDGADREEDGRGGGGRGGGGSEEQTGGEAETGARGGGEEGGGGEAEERGTHVSKTKQIYNRCDRRSV